MKYLISLLFLIAPLMQGQIPVFGGVTQTIVAPTVFDIIVADPTNIGPQTIRRIEATLSIPTDSYGLTIEACRFQVTWNAGTPYWTSYDYLATGNDIYTPIPSAKIAKTGRCQIDLAQTTIDYGKCTIFSPDPNTTPTTKDCVWGGPYAAPSNAIRFHVHMTNTGGFTKGRVKSLAYSGAAFSRIF